jgi:hypothetical protein
VRSIAIVQLNERGLPSFAAQEHEVIVTAFRKIIRHSRSTLTAEAQRTAEKNFTTEAQRAQRKSCYFLFPTATISPGEISALSVSVRQQLGKVRKALAINHIVMECPR